ncbi:hypothetical protein HZC07_02125 [Candidatus Micrarchaeota archaeon]|nr:hypothetical protein [Candidatus Micrarchaeota archaeon]
MRKLALALCLLLPASARAMPPPQRTPQRTDIADILIKSKFKEAPITDRSRNFGCTTSSVEKGQEI